jgi:hypothetical protein
MSIFKHKSGDVKLSGDQPGAGVIISRQTWEAVQAMPEPGSNGAALPMVHKDRIYVSAKTWREANEK